MREEREGKVIHGTFARETNKPVCDKVATHSWLRNGSFRAKTEGLLVAAQDVVTHTMTYCHCILKERFKPIYRECGEAMETLGHILSACEGYKWSLYKARHNGILNILVRAAAKRLGIQIPKNQWEDNQRVKSAVYGGIEAVILVVQCISTNDQIVARRPNLLTRVLEPKKIVILEVACAWEPLVKEREAPKKAKYVQGTGCRSCEPVDRLHSPECGSGDRKPCLGGGHKKRYSNVGPVGGKGNEEACAGHAGKCAKRSFKDMKFNQEARPKRNNRPPPPHLMSGWLFELCCSIKHA